MIEAMIGMGKTLLRDSNPISEKVKKLEPMTRKDEKRHVVKIDFRLQEEKIDLDIEEISSRTAARYVLLDREGGPNNPQWYITFEKCDNLISQSMPNFVKKLEEGDFKDQVAKVISTFFCDLGQDVDSKYRYVLDVHRFLGHSKSIEMMLQILKDNDEKTAHKKLVTTVAAEFVKYCEDKFELRKEQIGLFTISIDGESISQNPLYTELIEQSLAQRMADGSSDGLVCSICGTDEGCTSDLKDMSIKYYTTNQCIFARNMNNKNYDKNFVLCRDCYESLLTAEKFIKKELRSRIADFNVYIIPHILYGQQLDGQVLKKMASVIEPLIDSSKNIKNMSEFKDNVTNRLDKLNKQGGYSFLLNFLFYRQANQATKIQKMIKDVQPSVFKRIETSSNDVLQRFRCFFSEKACQFLYGKQYLKMIYYLHPIKLQDGNPAQYQRMLSVYEDIFYQRRLRKERVFTNIAEVLQIVWRQRAGYNVSNTDLQYFSFKVLEAMFYVAFLQKFGRLEGGENMLDSSSLTVKDELKEYMQAMHYNEQQAALFLLGVLIGAIGREQSKRSEEGAYKPVLNKINFNGMDKVRIMKLSGDLFNKLRQEKILKFTEGIYNAHVYLLGKNRECWTLSKDEGLFYLLSGYSFQTLRKKKDKEETANGNSERADAVSL
ncbi:hypothetical protein P22_4017 [Propionispora sp. 2/2-37]|uniref:TIGR02556 family CRISPR-associated protein n=1 Tax=Propionispora sp. 2/2-37 TaxID=1677858 RepID=UPI0006BB5995|nr:TIGR02556 family CRISPR-associated protein [Propionispora sp. 2/2-37]CUH97869.1 hypothetical protein P22_4017 [Propionispora sp. 2/2-37]